MDLRLEWEADNYRAENNQIRSSHNNLEEPIQNPHVVFLDDTRTSITVVQKRYVARNVKTLPEKDWR
jgi:hypothetical protein